MNQNPNFPNQLSVETPVSTAETQPGMEATKENVVRSAHSATARNSDAAPSDSEKPSGRLSLPPIREGMSFEERCQEAMRLAQEAFSQTGSWVVFYREILGYEGIVRKLFVEDPGETSESEGDEGSAQSQAAVALRRFEETPHFGSLLEMAAALRSQDTRKGDEFEPQKMITVRLPRSQHETLKKEAKEHETSINKLCISKLLLPIESRLVPIEKGKVRGRKPGPQGNRNQRLSETERAT